MNGVCVCVCVCVRACIDRRSMVCAVYTFTSSYMYPPVGSLSLGFLGWGGDVLGR